MSESKLYPSVVNDIANGDFDWEGATLRGILVSAGFLYDGSLVNRDELNESVVIAESEILAGADVVGDVYTGKPFEWLQLADNRDAYGVVVFDDTGDDAYSQLIAYFSSDFVDGLPVPLEGANYYLFPVSPPGGYFQVFDEEIIGPLNTYTPGFDILLSETLGEVSYSIPVLVFGLDLDVSERACLIADELDSDNCCEPTIRSSICG